MLRSGKHVGKGGCPPSAQMSCGTCRTNRDRGYAQFPATDQFGVGAGITDQLTLADGTQSISDWDNVKTGSVPGITN